jgi:lipopolysaccharide transport system ATP-binding protein
MSNLAVRVQGLGKRYRIGRAAQRHDSLRDAITHAAKAPFRNLSQLRRLSRFRDEEAADDVVWALRDATFEIPVGEAVGIIGRNGAGKSTLLKILSRITEPTAGRAEVRGRVGSLLEVGTGFHPELTGRENVYLNGSMLGMDRAYIDRKFDEIVEFAGVEKFVATPVKRYSSGMYLRLAFAVAAHLDPEVLIVDEVLAVGDAEFQRKCLGKMGEVAKGGRTVLLVSHNMAAIENLCRTAVLFDHGRLVAHGGVRETVQRYLQEVLPSTLGALPLAERRDRSGTGRVRLTSFHLEDGAGNPVGAAQSGADAVVVLGYECPPGVDPRRVDVGISVSTENDQMLFVLYSSYVNQEFGAVPTSGQIRCRLPRLPLAPSRYRLGARVTEGGDEADFPWNGVGYFEVEPGDFYRTGRSGFDGSTAFLVAGDWDVRDR